jgi:hypothetical protein
VKPDSTPKRRRTETVALIAAAAATIVSAAIQVTDFFMRRRHSRMDTQVDDSSATDLATVNCSSRSRRVLQWLGIIAMVATVVGVVIAAVQLAVSLRGAPRSLPELRAERDCTDSSPEAAAMLGAWYLPLSKRTVMIDANPADCRALIIRSSDDAMRGTGTVDAGTATLHVLIDVRRDSLEIVREAQITVRLSSDAKTLAGNFRGNDPAERGPVAWFRPRRPSST